MGVRACRTAGHADMRDRSIRPHHLAPIPETAVSPAIIGALGILSLLILLFLRIPVWAALMFIGFTGNCILSGLHSALSLAGTSAFDVSAAYTLSVIPLFVLLGEVASSTRL